VLRLIFALLIVICSGCAEYFEPSNPPSVNPQEDLTGEALNFNLVSNEILIPHCVQCHSKFANYETVSRRSKSILSSVESNDMPLEAPPLSDNLKAMLRQWIEAGAPLE
jgi:hypothetical protein